MRIRILTVSVLRFGIISSLPWSRAGARIFARESTSSYQPIRNENAVASSLYTFGHQNFQDSKGSWPLRSRSRWEQTIARVKSGRSVYLRVSAACFPNFFKSRSNVSRSFLERTPATSSIAAACSPTPWVISPFIVSFSNTSDQLVQSRSKSFRMGDFRLFVAKDQIDSRRVSFETFPFPSQRREWGSLLGRTAKYRGRDIAPKPKSDDLEV